MQYITPRPNKKHPSYRSLHPSKDSLFKTSNFVTLFPVFFCGSSLSFGIRIQPTEINADPDSQHCLPLGLLFSGSGL
jgi:hypothetical protein